MKDFLCCGVGRWVVVVVGMTHDDNVMAVSCYHHQPTLHHHHVIASTHPLTSHSPLTHSPRAHTH